MTTYFKIILKKFTEKYFVPFFNPKYSTSQSIGLLNVGDATRIHPNTNSSSARHFTGVMFLPNNSTAKAAVENIFNYRRKRRKPRGRGRNKKRRKK